MLGGNRTRALKQVHWQSTPYDQGGWLNPEHGVKPDWMNAPYVYKGTSNASSFNHKQPGAYRDKSERPAVTGAYKGDSRRDAQAQLFGALRMMATNVSQKTKDHHGA